MPNLPISQLPEITATTSNAEYVVAQDGVTYKIKRGYMASGKIHADYYSELTQGAATINTAYAMSATSFNSSVGISLLDNSKFVVASGGTYNVQFSSVFEKAQGGSLETVSVWFRVNGNNVPWSNTEISMANNNELIVAAWNILLELNPSDFVEIVWSSTSDQMNMTALPAQSNPSRPGTPSVIITIVQI